MFIVCLYSHTGLGKTSEIRICEVGAILLDQEMNELSQFEEYVNPKRDIGSGATAVNGITNDFVKNLDDWSVVGLRFYQWIAGFAEGLPVTLCAHNAKRFDGRILFFENSRHKVPNLPNLFLSDSIPVFKELFPNCSDYKLGTIYFEQFKEKISNQHTALGDVTAMLRLLECYDHQLVRDKVTKHNESFSAVIKRCLN